MNQEQREERFDVDDQLANEQADAKAQAGQHTSHFWQKSWFWIVVVVIAAVGAYGYFSGFSGFSGIGSVNNGGSNGDVVAVVNGEEITQEEFDARLAQAQANAQGGEVDRAQMVETMINTELILQDAAAQGITVSDQDVEEYYQNQVLAGGTTEAQLEQQLSQSGFTIANLKEDIHDQLVIQAYIEANASSDADISDQQVQDYYDQLAEQQPEGSEFPALADVETQIRQQLQSQQQNQVIQQILDELRADADIENNFSSDQQ